MRKKEAIVVGWINTGKPADCGETMKNQLQYQHHQLQNILIRYHLVFCFPLQIGN